MIRVNDLYLTDEDRYACEEDSEVELLRNELEKIKEKNGDYEYSIEQVKKILNKTIEINQRCLLEKLDKAIYELIKMETDRCLEILEWLTFEE